jgi:hypothetical protein
MSRVGQPQTEVDDHADDYSGAYDYAAPKKQKQSHYRSDVVFLLSTLTVQF